MAGDSGAANKTQLANYLMKYISSIGNTVNICQEEDKDADGKKKKQRNKKKGGTLEINFHI